MNDMTPGLFDDELPSVALENIVFDYRLISEDKREFVLQKTDETQILLKRTAEKVIQIGKNLLAVQAILPHGMFLPWLQSEFGMSQSAAYNFIHVAEKFDGKLTTVVNLPAKALYLLASPSTSQEAINEALQRAESGEKITHALAKQIIEAQDAIKKAQDAEAQARADAQVAQQRLFKVQAEASSKSDELSRQIEALQDEMERLTTPEVRIQIEHVLPPEKQAELEGLEEKVRELEASLAREKATIPPEKQVEFTNLQADVQELTKNLEEEKKAIPPSTQKQLATLQKQLDRLKEERQQQDELTQQQSERIAKLYADIDASIHKREFAENADRIRQGWRMINSEVHTCLMRLLGQWPTPVDVQTFDADDWARVDHLKSTLRRVLEECEHLRYESNGAVVDMNIYGMIESN